MPDGHEVPPYYLTGVGRGFRRGRGLLFGNKGAGLFFPFFDTFGREPDTTFRQALFAASLFVSGLSVGLRVYKNLHGCAARHHCPPWIRLCKTIAEVPICAGYCPFFPRQNRKGRQEEGEPASGKARSSGWPAHPPSRDRQRMAEGAIGSQAEGPSTPKPRERSCSALAARQIALGDLGTTGRITAKRPKPSRASPT